MHSLRRRAPFDVDKVLAQIGDDAWDWECNPELHVTVKPSANLLVSSFALGDFSDLWRRLDPIPVVKSARSFQAPTAKAHKKFQIGTISVPTPPRRITPEEVANAHAVLLARANEFMDREEIFTDEEARQFDVIMEMLKAFEGR